MAITEFRGRHAFLSNFSVAPITRRGITYPTAEHAYQAAKTRSLSARREIAKAVSPKQAKHLGFKVKIREDWEDVKYKIMKGIVRQKFLQNPNLITLLLFTDPEDLIHENNHGDRYWGTVNGVGLNMLGVILMELRLEFLQNR